MNLQELKCKTPAELLAFAEELQIENASTLRKQDMMFAILKALVVVLSLVQLLGTWFSQIMAVQT